DITAHKQAEEALRMSEENLRQSQKMDSIGLLAGGIAHDFNNMLTPILGYSEILLEQLDENDPLREGMEEINKAGERASTLTRQLLAFSRKQPLQSRVLNLNILIAEMEKMLRRLIGEDIHLITNLHPQLVEIKADPGQIEQIILNLTINARDAMSAGGRIAIETSNFTVNEEDENSLSVQPGEFVCLSVKDTGVGMDEDTIARIFEPFFSTKELGRGTGLGLSVVDGIAAQHGGWVKVDSALGRGSTFQVCVPALSEEEAANIDEYEDELENQEGKNKRILLAEDEPTVREFATKTLRASGYIVFAASSAEEALQIFYEENGVFDLVFSDVVMPGISGVQLAEELYSRNPDLGVLLSSGYADEKSQWSVIREKEIPFLQKPYGMSDLLKAIRKAMESSSDKTRR
ncbi:MAG: ATP-binding protein, partial [Chloroflexota bacterium]|nr:ATP-binding protein [Chloroflexota bacterium]